MQAGWQEVDSTPKTDTPTTHSNRPAMRLEAIAHRYLGSRNAKKLAAAAHNSRSRSLQPPVPVSCHSHPWAAAYTDTQHSQPWPLSFRLFESHAVGHFRRYICILGQRQTCASKMGVTTRRKANACQSEAKGNVIL